MALKLTGYYRPEDIEVDRGAFGAGNVKFCSSDTGNEGSDHLWGEVVCLTDGTFSQAGALTSTLKLQLLVVGSADLAMPDNLAFQPGRGNWIVHEDGDIDITHKKNDLWDCLPDGTDADGLSDGCIRIGVLHDLISNDGEGAEWTGGIFDASGTRFFVSVQHNMTGLGVAGAGNGLPSKSSSTIASAFRRPTGQTSRPRSGDTGNPVRLVDEGHGRPSTDPRPSTEDPIPHPGAQ